MTLGSANLRRLTDGPFSTEEELLPGTVTLVVETSLRLAGSGFGVVEEASPKMDLYINGGDGSSRPVMVLPSSASELLRNGMFDEKRRSRFVSLGRFRSPLDVRDSMTLANRFVRFSGRSIIKR